jgi:hypothetical protein
LLKPFDELHWRKPEQGQKNRAKWLYFLQNKQLSSGGKPSAKNLEIPILCPGISLDFTDFCQIVKMNS